MPYLVAVALAVIVFWAFYCWATLGGSVNVITNQAWSMGETAKHLSRWEGFTTGFIWPYSRNVVRDPRRMPDLYNPPLYILILAAIFKIFGANEISILICNLLLYCAAVALVLLLGRSLFGPLGGAVCTAAFMLNGPVLLGLVGGDGSILTVALGAALFYLLLNPRKEDPRYFIALGAIIGLCYLTLYELGFLLIPLGVYLYRTSRGDRAREAGALAAGFIAVACLWWLRNMVVAGNPFYTFRWHELFSIGSPLLSTAPLEGRYFNYQWLYHLPVQAFNSLSIYGNPLMLFVVISFFYRFENPKMQRLRSLLCLLFFSMVVVQTWHPHLAPVTYLPLMPAAIMACFGFVTFLIKRYESSSPWRMRLALAFFLLFALLPMKPVNPPRHGFVKNLYSKLLSPVGKDDFIMTDVPLQLAWMHDRRAIAMPPTFDDSLKIWEWIGGPLAVFLSGDFLDDEAGEEWKPVYDMAREGKIPESLRARAGWLCSGSGHLNGVVLLDFPPPAPPSGGLRGQTASGGAASRT